MGGTVVGLGGVTQHAATAIPAPVPQNLRAAAAPAAHILSPVARRTPAQPIATALAPVTHLIDPAIGELPVVDDVLGSNAAQSLTAPIEGLLDGVVKDLTTVLPMTVTPLPGSVGSTSSIGTASPASSAGALAIVFRHHAVSSGDFSDTRMSLSSRGTADGSASTSRGFSPVGSNWPVGPDPLNVPLGQTPAPADGGSGAPGGGGSGGSGAASALAPSLGFPFPHAAIALRALDSDDALPASPSFDLGSTPD